MKNSTWSKWSYFLDFFFERGNGEGNYQLRKLDELRGLSWGRHCGQRMRYLVSYSENEVTGRRVKRFKAEYCEICHFLAYEMDYM